MRALVLLCLLHGAFLKNPFSWNEGAATRIQEQPYVCRADQASCGCCLMQKKMQRMESFFNMTVEELSKNLTNSKMALDDVRASRSAFSVSLHDATNDDCFGPFTDDRVIRYQHVFLNLGDGYDARTGTFTAPRSGVYSLAVTVYSDAVIGPGAHLAVNSQVVATLQEKKSQDLDDSATAVVSVKLKAGDKVAVQLPKGSLICDRQSYLNTFTGFLLYPC
ncbi:hypothetical protein VZT92_020419 [Zoarces viviparus]|uniref:C1q domain-containing protein n=2 Tax=Zoarces viviparus TaxID=48416 RepID=A0AAW1EFT7_ZOAVI